jgi:hypothetical protein
MCCGKKGAKTAGKSLKKQNFHRLLKFLFEEWAIC